MNIQLDATKIASDTAFQLIRDRLVDIFRIFDEDPSVTEINYNGPGKCFVMRKGVRSLIEVPPLSETRVESVLKNLASSMGQEAEPGTPTGSITAKMPGFRFSGILAPIAAFGSAFSIRRHNPRVLALSDYVEFGSVPESVAALLSDSVRRGVNILIGGGTDTGKTTFLNALSREIPADQRVGTIEDTREVSLLISNWIALETNAPKGVTAQHCLKDLMRHSPDRIILGELRDGVAADFISASNTGHHGCMATLHCNSAALALERMEDLCLQGNTDWPLTAIQRNIGRSIGLVVQFRKSADQRVLSEVIELKGFDAVSNRYQINKVFNHQEH